MCFNNTTTQLSVGLDVNLLRSPENVLKGGVEEEEEVCVCVCVRV